MSEATIPPTPPMPTTMAEETARFDWVTVELADQAMMPGRLAFGDRVSAELGHSHLS